MPTRSIAGLLVIATATLIAAGCATRPAPEPFPGAPDRAGAVRRAIVEWLECEECRAGELEAVVRLEQAAVPSLVAALREGPPPVRREAQRRHLIATYQRLKLTMSEDDYVRRYAENYEALYRIRAADALAAIGGPTARQALEAAAAQPYREDVTRAVRAAQARLQKP